jgi:hypothetical protein
MQKGPDVADPFSVLVPILRARLTESGHRWLDRACATTGDLNRLLGSYTAASRQAGLAPLDLSPSEHASLTALAPCLDCRFWSVADVARAVLLLASAEGTADSSAWVTTAISCFENGDAGEQQSWLKSVSLLPHADRFATVAIDACRSHIQPLFDSIACENPFPAAYFSERQFNQLVLKAMFTGVRLERIVGLARRVNPELSRMARDYAAERSAAGRSVPADLALALDTAPALQEHLS